MMEFEVKDMSCGHCAGAVTKAVKSVDPEAKVDIDLATKKVHVETGKDRKSIADALAGAGYPVSS